MKKAFALTLFLSFQTPQPKEYNFKLTEADVQVIWDAVDNSNQPGSVRKPLLQKIVSQYQAQQAAPDTSKHKK